MGRAAVASRRPLIGSGACGMGSEDLGFLLGQAMAQHRLGISEGTVRTHLENIYRLLQVSSRTAAVTRAFADRTG